jgi:hypothetical protein
MSIQLQKSIITIVYLSIFGVAIAFGKSKLKKVYHKKNPPNKMNYRMGKIAMKKKLLVSK